MNEYFKKISYYKSNRYHKFFNFDALEKLTFGQIGSVETVEKYMYIQL